MTAVAVSVIVPTYCEAENLRILVPRVAATLRQAQMTFEIVVVDDNSPDATGHICRDLATLHCVRLEIRTCQRGLATAVLHGMRRAVGDVLVIMDADLSHPPESIPALVRCLENGADFAIGSRYIRGGGTSHKWGTLRWLNSNVATLLARPFTNVHDPMAGFFAIRRATFQSVEEYLDPIGYKIALELLVKGGCAVVREVPIHFSNRAYGYSKLSFNEQLNYLRHLERLYEFKYGGVVCLLRFVLVGGTGVAVNLAMYALLLQFVPLGVARAIAIWSAMTWNFALNRRFTFVSAANRRSLLHYFGFCLTCSVGGVINWVISMAASCVATFLVGRPLCAAVIGTIIGGIFNYLCCSLVLFRGARSHWGRRSVLAQRELEEAPRGASE